MEKVWKRLIAVSLSLMLMFTMGLNVFAAETVEPPDDPAVTLDQDDAVATEAEPAGEEVVLEDETVVQEEEPAEEAVVQEDEPEVKAMDGETGTEATPLEEVLTSIGELSNDPRDFTAADVERVEAIWAAYEALSAEDQATVDSTFNHPSGDGQSYGRVLEAAVWAVRSFTTDTSTTLAPGTYTTETSPAVSSESSKGKSDSSRTRNWWVERVEVSDEGQATAYIYVTSGAATASKLTSYPSVWTGGQTIERDANNNYPIPVDLNGTTYFGGISSSMPRPIMYSLSTTIDEPVSLEITNNLSMFKAMKACLTTENEQEYLIMALSGTGYHELYKGTYEQAVANGDGTADKGNDSWIHGEINSDGLWEFKIPVNADETYVPLVAVSNRYYENYLKNENALERAFYPRQFTLNREAKTLVTDDFKTSKDLEVKNNVSMFTVNAARLDKVGGPNSNDYSSTLVLTMGSTSYDKMYIGRIAEAEEAETTIPLEENNTFKGKVMWIKDAGQPESIETLIGEPFVLSFHSVRKDSWYERWATIDSEETYVQFDSVTYADYSGVDAAIANVPENLDIYTPSTAQAVKDAVNAVYRYKFPSEQFDVDNMATAINEAVAALKEKTDISEATIDAIPAQSYTGKAITPEVRVTLGEAALENGTDYTVEYANNTNKGEATVTVTGKDNYAGSISAKFKINAKKITPAVTLSTTTYTYNGKAKAPAVTVKDGAKKLTKNTDYTVSYAKGRINAGSYKVTVTLKGNYSGSAYKTIKINPAAQKLTMSAAQKSVKFKALKKKAQTTSKVAVSGAKTKVTYAKVSGSKKLTINKTTGKITVKKKTKKGTYSIKVKATAAKSTNYKAATVTKTIKVKVK